MLLPLFCGLSAYDPCDIDLKFIINVTATVRTRYH